MLKVEVDRALSCQGYMQQGASRDQGRLPVFAGSGGLAASCDEWVAATVLRAMIWHH